MHIQPILLKEPRAFSPQFVEFKKMTSRDVFTPPPPSLTTRSTESQYISKAALRPYVLECFMSFRHVPQIKFSKVTPRLSNIFDLTKVHSL